VVGAPVEEGSGAAEVECGEEEDGNEEDPHEEDGEEDCGGAGEGAGGVKRGGGVEGDCGPHHAGVEGGRGGCGGEYVIDCFSRGWSRLVLMNMCEGEGRAIDDWEVGRGKIENIYNLLYLLRAHESKQITVLGCVLEGV